MINMNVITHENKFRHFSERHMYDSVKNNSEPYFHIQDIYIYITMVDIGNLDFNLMLRFLKLFVVLTIKDVQVS